MNVLLISYPDGAFQGSIALHAKEQQGRDASNIFITDAFEA